MLWRPSATSFADDTLFPTDVVSTEYIAPIANDNFVSCSHFSVKPCRSTAFWFRNPAISGRIISSSQYRATDSSNSEKRIVIAPISRNSASLHSASRSWRRAFVAIRAVTRCSTFLLKRSSFVICSRANQCRQPPSNDRSIVQVHTTNGGDTGPDAVGGRSFANRATATSPSTPAFHGIRIERRLRLRAGYGVDRLRHDLDANTERHHPGLPVRGSPSLPAPPRHEGGANISALCWTTRESVNDSVHCRTGTHTRIPDSPFLRLRWWKDDSRQPRFRRSPGRPRVECEIDAEFDREATERTGYTPAENPVEGPLSRPQFSVRSEEHTSELQSPMY